MFGVTTPCVGSVRASLEAKGLDPLVFHATGTGGQAMEKLVVDGLIVGVLGQTGLGVKITSLIVELSGGWLPAALLLTALACLILGMEVPTTAAYVICISVAGPALQQLGVPLLAAHLFVFWYALISTITPPVSSSS